MTTTKTPLLPAVGFDAKHKAAVRAMFAAHDDAAIRVEAARVAGLYSLTVDRVLDAYETAFNSCGPGASVEERVSEACHRLTWEAEDAGVMPTA